MIFGVKRRQLDAQLDNPHVYQLRPISNLNEKARHLSDRACDSSIVSLHSIERVAEVDTTSLVAERAPSKRALVTIALREAIVWPYLPNLPKLRQSDIHEFYSPRVSNDFESSLFVCRCSSPHTRLA